MRKITHSNEIFSFLHIRTTMAENFTQISNRLTFPRIAREGGTKRWKGDYRIPLPQPSAAPPMGWNQK